MLAFPAGVKFGLAAGAGCAAALAVVAAGFLPSVASFVPARTGATHAAASSEVEIHTITFGISGVSSFFYRERFCSTSLRAWDCVTAETRIVHFIRVMNGPRFGT